jgi:hypothetical protein
MIVNVGYDWEIVDLWWCCLTAWLLGGELNVWEWESGAAEGGVDGGTKLFELNSWRLATAQSSW